MTIREFLNLDSYDTDKTTGQKLTHAQKYDKLIDALGRNAVIRCVPFSKDEISKAIKTDEHLNNLPMRRWDYAAGFIFSTKGGTETFAKISTGLTALFQNHGINSFSPAEGVCTLKEAARIMIEGEIK